MTTGLSTFSTISVTGLTTTNDFFTSGLSTFTGNIDANGNLDVDGTTELDGLNVDGSSTLDAVTTDGLLDINAGGQANTFKIEDLTSGRVDLAGTDGEIEDSANLTFDGSTLTVTGGVTVSTNIDVDGQTQLDELNVAGVTTFNNGVLFTGISTFNDNIIVAEQKEIQLGGNKDLRLYHDGHSIIQNDESGACLFIASHETRISNTCLLYTSDAADE